jgi:hypothetical protein
MTEKAEHTLTLDRPATYRIRVPGHLAKGWSDWAGEMSIAVHDEGDGRPVTTLTGPLDQAALHGLLSRLYTLGLPLISVCLDDGDLCADRD